MAQPPIYIYKHTDQPACRCLIIKLSIQVVTVVTYHDQLYNSHAWMDTQQWVANHKPDKLSQSAPAQSETQEARQAIP